MVNLNPDASPSTEYSSIITSTSLILMNCPMKKRFLERAIHFQKGMSPGETGQRRRQSQDLFTRLCIYQYAGILGCERGGLF
jgi:hypothetical protein